MKEINVLGSPRLPARISVEQTAELLGFQEHDISVLIRKRLLKPLGKPAPNAPKWFASSIILKLIENDEWLSNATKTISENWKIKNKSILNPN